MATQEIPQEQWKTFFDEISREYQSGQVSVERRGQPVPQQDAITQMTLIGVTYEDKGSGQGRIDIMVGSDTDTNTSHTISHPTTVRTEAASDGSVASVQIDAQDEPVTILRLLSAT